MITEENKIKLAVVTGCLGFIGSEVTKQLLLNGYHVYGIDKMTYAANEDMLTHFSGYEQFEFNKCDINDLTDIPECDFIINTAAESHVGNSIEDSRKFMRSNIDGVHNILEILRRKQSHNYRKPTLIHFSTDEVYGDMLDEEKKFDENSLLNPSNPYSATKAAADMLIMSWGRTHGIDYIILRPSNNYGNGQYPEKLIPLSVKCLQRGLPIKLHNKGFPVRTWLHVEDTANAVLTVMKYGVKNNVYNISGGFEQANYKTVKSIIYSFFDVSDMTDEQFNQYVDLSYSRPGQDVRYAIHDDKIRSLGWKPKKQFEKEIKNIVSYYKKKFRW